MRRTLALTVSPIVKDHHVRLKLAADPLHVRATERQITSVAVTEEDLHAGFRMRNEPGVNPGSVLGRERDVLVDQARRWRRGAIAIRQIHQPGFQKHHHKHNHQIHARQTPEPNEGPSGQPLRIGKPLRWRLGSGCGHDFPVRGEWKRKRFARPQTSGDQLVGIVRNRYIAQSC